MVIEINLNELFIIKLNINKNNKIGIVFFILEYLIFIIIYINDSVILIIFVNVCFFFLGVVDVLWIKWLFIVNIFNVLILV